MTSERVKELERKLADLKRRWPPHSVPPRMLEQLEELEDALKKAREADI
ncbi:MAG: histidine kinase [Dehalococcoidia bacterium]|nr:MAG: histidine kinase [Dehalococcoidia bacterium]